MTNQPNHKISLRAPGAIRTSLATGVLAAALVLTGAAGALADGGVGTSGDGSGDRSGDGNKYDREWDSFSKRNKRWARKTSECESGGDPKIHSPGGEYHGAFQFSTPTWKTSPMSPGGRHADKYSWKVQAVVAVKLKQRDGAGHWPVCG